MMFERLQKPFLTVETGEAYQPILLTYELKNESRLTETLNQLSCCERSPTSSTWQWFWRDECDTLHFESLDSYKKIPGRPVRLGTFSIKNSLLCLNLPSFKRACLAVPFFHRYLPSDVATILHADFINKVFGLDERLPHGFSELFKDDELDTIIEQRIKGYETVQQKVEQAKNAEEALAILSQYTEAETKKRLPFAERYAFQQETNGDAEVIFLGFYIFLRGRELVAIRRWFGESGYTLSDAAEEAIEQVFGGMDIDLLE